MLFATCLAILGALLLEMPSPATFRLAVALAPIYYWAIRANNRRLAYADLALSRWSSGSSLPGDRSSGGRPGSWRSEPLPILLYVGVGWTSRQAPSGRCRSSVDARSEG